jgi:predicted lipoprotein with Yx(FWY)xxD motif
MRAKILIATAIASAAALSVATVAAADERKAESAAKKRPKLAITDGDFGKHLANAKGRALYVFTSDSGATSNCYGDCARAWPPYIVNARPRAVEGARQSLVGVTRRTDGRLQATYAGHPVYYYVGDKSPGEVLCQAVEEFGGFWYILRAGGKVVR